MPGYSFRSFGTLFCQDMTGSQILSLIQSSDISINISSFQDTTFPPLPHHIKALFLQSSPKLRGILEFPPQLEKLFLQNLHPDVAKGLPSVPLSVTEFGLANCGATEIPPLSYSIQMISMENNQIRDMPEEWPETLEYLNLNNNQIRTIPPLYMKDTDFLSLDNNPLEEPFASIYARYREYMEEILEQGTTNIIPATQYLKTAINGLYDLHQGFRQRKQNLKSQAKGLLALKQLEAEGSVLPPELFREIGSQLSGQPVSKTLNQQLQAVKQKFPEFQPAGITQQPALSAYEKRIENSKTRRRLRNLLFQESNIARKKLPGKGGKQRAKKTRKQ
jgi:hypothetical protein